MSHPNNTSLTAAKLHPQNLGHSPTECNHEKEQIVAKFALWVGLLDAVEGPSLLRPRACMKQKPAKRPKSALRKRQERMDAGTVERWNGHSWGYSAKRALQRRACRNVRTATNPVDRLLQFGHSEKCSEMGKRENVETCRHHRRMSRLDQLSPSPKCRGYRPGATWPTTSMCCSGFCSNERKSLRSYASHCPWTTPLQQLVDRLPAYLGTLIQATWSVTARVGCMPRFYSALCLVSDVWLSLCMDSWIRLMVQSKT